MVRTVSPDGSLFENCKFQSYDFAGNDISACREPAGTAASLAHSVKACSFKKGCSLGAERSVFVTAVALIADGKKSVGSKVDSYEVAFVVFCKVLIVRILKFIVRIFIIVFRIKQSKEEVVEST